MYLPKLLTHFVATIIAAYVSATPPEMFEIDILIIADFSMDVQIVSVLPIHHPLVYLMIRQLTFATNSQ